MAFTKVEDWSETAASNTEINGIVLSDSTQIDALDNIEREHMAQIAKWVGDDTVASAATADLGAVPGRYINITGTTTITAFGTIKAGTIKYVKFAGALTLTHNATSLILPGAANITTAAGDTAIFVSEGSGNWRCVVYAAAAPAPNTANGQYKFPATQNASSNANTLDDYEEGTFTPVVAGSTAGGSGTYSTQSGQYTKIGNAVFFTYFVIYTGHTGTGNMLLTNLPFTAGSVPTAVSVWVSTLTFTGQIVGFVENGATRIALYTATDGASSSQIAMDAAASILVSGHYFV